MSYLRLPLIYVLIPALFYPLYFLIVNIIDSLLGEQQLINWLQFESHQLLLTTFLYDWLNALPVMFGIFYIIVLPTKYLMSKSHLKNSLSLALICAGIAYLLSFMIGFRNLALLANSLSVFSFVIFYTSSHKMAARYL